MIPLFQKMNRRLFTPVPKGGRAVFKCGHIKTGVNGALNLDRADKVPAKR